MSIAMEAQSFARESPLLRVAIVDGDPLSRRRIRALIESRHDVLVVAECSSAAEALPMIRAVAPDVLFLDVEIPHGSGFTIIETLDERISPAVIFVTRHESYAVQAFAVRAVDYLLKPLHPRRFHQSLERARDFLWSRAAKSACRDALSELPTRRYAERIAVKAASGVTFVRTGDVSWIEAAGNYAQVHTERDSHLVRETMSHLEATLDPSRFVRTHRSSIVNVDRIVQLMPSFGRNHVILLKNGTRVTLSAQYRESLRRLGFSF